MRCGYTFQNKANGQNIKFSIKGNFFQIGTSHPEDSELNRKVRYGKCANANAIAHLYQQNYVSASVVIQCLGQLVEIGNASSLGYFTELLFYADEKFEQEVGADRSKLDEVKRHIFAFEKIVYEGKIEFESLDRKILVEAGLRLDEYYAE